MAPHQNGGVPQFPLYEISTAKLSPDPPPPRCNRQPSHQILRPSLPRVPPTPISHVRSPVQGSLGSHFYQPIGQCVQDLRAKGKRVEVVFKGFHEGIDSFGAFRYPDAAPSFSRLAHSTAAATEAPERHPRLHGCALVTWTGACILKRSNEKEDINAPPDVLAAHRRVTLSEWFRKEGVRRVFACGLAADFCVLDTVLNAKAEGFEEAYMVLDATRAAHLPGVPRLIRTCRGGGGGVRAVTG